jgi:hypothetical protein
MRVTRRHSTRNALGAVLTAGLATLGTAVVPTVTEAAGGGSAGVDHRTEMAHPHVLNGGDAADVIVRVFGDSVCSGTPIAGTPFVTTAAHCVLDGAGEVSAVTVARDGVEYTPRAVLVNAHYVDAASAHLDAAVLVMERAIPGPAATLGDIMPTQGLVTLAGFQPIDTDGSLLRGRSVSDRPNPKGFTGGVIEIQSRPSGCVDRASSIRIAGDQLRVRCGLIPGASGGGLFADRGGKLVLLGITSNVDVGLAINGLAPLATVHELLSHPGEYTHAIPAAGPSAPPPPIAHQ